MVVHAFSSSTQEAKTASFRTARATQTQKNIILGGRGRKENMLGSIRPSGGGLVGVLWREQGAMVETHDRAYVVTETEVPRHTASWRPMNTGRVT